MRCNCFSYVTTFYVFKHRKGFGASLVRRVRKAGSEFLNKVIVIVIFICTINNISSAQINHDEMIKHTNVLESTFVDRRFEATGQ